MGKVPFTDRALARFLSPERRGTDSWGEWRRTDNPGDGFARHGNARVACSTVWENEKFRVTGGDLDFGGVIWTHLAVYQKRPRRGPGSTFDYEPRWRDLQRIKNELCGEDAVAIHIMPRQSDVYAVSDVYHLWICPPGFALPNLVWPVEA